MPKLWIGNKMYFVDDDEVRDYCEKLEERITEIEAENKKLEELLHFGCQDQTMISLIHKAKINKEQALKGE